MTVKRRLFGTKEFYKNALLLALPVMGQSLIQNLVTLIDNFMVAGLGDIKMSGTSIVGDYVFVITVLLNAICMAGGIFVTQYYGAKEKEGMKQAVYFKAILSIVVLIIVEFVFTVFPKEALGLMVMGNSQADVIIDEGIKYLRVILLTVPFMVVTYICSSSLKDTENVKAPLYFSLVAALINMFFNYCFIYGNLGFPRLELVGAAIATLIARVCETIAYIVYVKKIDASFLIRIKDITKIDRRLFKDMLKTSVMVIISESIWALAETVTTAVYNGRGGADVVSGMSASFTIANLYFVAFGGINVATCVIIGKLLGEGKLEEAREKRRWLSSGITVFSLIIMLFAMMTALLVPILYGNLSDAAQTIAIEMVFYMALLMPPWIILNVQLAISRSGGDTKMGFIFDGLANLFLLIPLVIILAKLTNLGPVEIYIISKFVDVIKIVACFFWLNQERWLVNLTTKDV